MNEKIVLLQTDLVDSTRLSVRLGDKANAMVRAEHDAVSRDLLATWRGQELERSDGFLLRFESVANATEFAIAYHQAIGRLDVPLQARVGIHLGTLEFHHNSESHVSLGAKDVEPAGLSIAMTVRIMSVAAGGQTLLSAIARTALGDTDRALVSHGYWRLKGVDEPLELFEIGPLDAPFSPPPDAPKAYRVVRKNDLWLPRREIPYTLPGERNSFVGRKAGLREIGTRIAGNERLLTVLGTGGTGKTRLVQHFGWSHLGDFPGGVWFCDLSNARSLDSLCGAVAQGLAFALGNNEPVEQIGNAIAGRGTCLVILDNFEQIIDCASQSVGRWLDRTVDATFIVTSRSTLGLDGEQVLSLAPLDQVDGAELFVHRAKASGRDLEDSPESDAQVRSLIKLLDGLPLAIELAAARTRVLDIVTLASRMRDRFKLLSSGEGRPSRQATLRATFDWSWDLLNVEDRSALAQLSVFEGGFTVDAAEGICRLSNEDRSIDAIDVLQSLLDKSWIRRTSQSRFDLLKSVQEYAAERLRADPDRCRAAEERHGLWFASLTEQKATVDRCVEVDNLAIATKRAVARGDPVTAVAVLERAWFALRLSGPYRAATTLATEVLSLSTLAPADRCAAQFVLGDALQSSGAIDDAIVHFEQGLAVARACGARTQEARILCGLGERLTEAARVDVARQTLDDALAMAEELRDEELQCNVLNALGNLRQSYGEAQAAQRWYERALTIARKLGHRRWEGGLFGNLGVMHAMQGHVVQAQSYYNLAIARAEELGDKRWENNARCNLGLLLGESGDFVNARLELERASGSAREIGHSRLECVVACNLGVICEKAGDRPASRRYYERALNLAVDLHDIRMEGQTRGHFGLLLARGGEHEAARSHFEAGEAILSQVADELSLGAILCQRAEADLLSDARESALARWQRASAIADRISVEKDAPLRLAIDGLAGRFSSSPERRGV